jgi:hypothetical protein
METATYMQDYSMRGQHTPDRALTRYSSDIAKMVEDQEISTGSIRWVMGVPNAYGNAVFSDTPTMINQKWGASHNMESTKTDMESDLWNLGRPTVRTTCGQYGPGVGLAANAVLTPMPSQQFPQVPTHLVDPPATLRGTGINRWEWLDTDPQAQVMIPFEHGINTQMAARDAGIHNVCRDPFIGSQEFGLPAPRAPRVGEPRSFSNELPSVSSGDWSMGPPPIARFTPTGYATRSDSTNGFAAVPMSDNPVERMRGLTGIISPPPPFSSMIAPH